MPARRVAALYGGEAPLAAALASRLAADGMDVALLGADLTGGESVEKALRRVADELGPPTVLVACLGDGGREPDAELRTAFLLTREAVEHMVDQWWGRIVLLPSTGAGRTLGHAVAGFVKTVALECGVFGVTANAVEVATDPSLCEGAAHAVSFLAGENASFVSGQVIRIDRPAEG